MSKREAILCDVEEETVNWSSGKSSTRRSTCDNRAIDKCVLCQRDYCTDHALHPKRGLILKAESLTIKSVAGGVPSEMAYGAGEVNSGIPGRQPEIPIYRIAICMPCRKSFSDTTLQSALNDAAQQFVKILGAAITAKALSAK